MASSVHDWWNDSEYAILVDFGQQRVFGGTPACRQDTEPDRELVRNVLNQPAARPRPFACTGVAGRGAGTICTHTSVGTYVGRSSCVPP